MQCWSFRLPVRPRYGTASFGAQSAEVAVSRQRPLDPEWTGSVPGSRRDPGLSGVVWMWQKHGGAGGDAAASHGHHLRRGVETHRTRPAPTESPRPASVARTSGWFGVSRPDDAAESADARGRASARHLESASILQQCPMAQNAGARPVGTRWHRCATVPGLPTRTQRRHAATLGHRPGYRPRTAAAHCRRTHHKLGRGRGWSGDGGAEWTLP